MAVKLTRREGTDAIFLDAYDKPAAGAVPFMQNVAGVKRAREIAERSAHLL